MAAGSRGSMRGAAYDVLRSAAERRGGVPHASHRASRREAQEHSAGATRRWIARQVVVRLREQGSRKRPVRPVSMRRQKGAHHSRARSLARSYMPTPMPLHDGRPRCFGRASAASWSNRSLGRRPRRSRADRPLGASRNARKLSFRLSCRCDAACRPKPKRTYG
eukprot:scaffold38990_cov26-Tisochrysis_lutea.AAC.5